MINLPGFDDIPGLSQKVIDQSMNCLRFLQRWTTEEKPCASYKFQQDYAFRPSQVSALIGYLRIQGYPIGSNGKGYFWAENPNELDITIEHMESRLRRQYIITEKLRSIRSAMREGYQQQEIFE